MATADEAAVRAQWNFAAGVEDISPAEEHHGVLGSGAQIVPETGAVLDGTSNGVITVPYSESFQPEAAGDGEAWKVELTGVTPAAPISSYRTIMGSRNNENGWALYLNGGKIEFWMSQTGTGTGYAKALSGVTAQVGKSYDITVQRAGNKISIDVSGDGEGHGEATIAGGYNAVDAGATLRFGSGGNANKPQYFYSGAIGTATISVDEVDDETGPVDPTGPVVIPTPEFPLTDAQYEDAAAAVFARTAGAAASQMSFDMQRSEQNVEQFTISGTDGAISIVASTPSALTMGAGWYLKYVVNASVNLGSAYPDMPATLPAPEAPITKTGHDAYRFALNDTNEGYTDPYLDWAGWERLLDNMALHGVNQVFMTVGTDAVFAELLQRWHYSEAEAFNWIPQPSHQPWWVLQNISNENGQPPMTKALLAERASLAKRIVNRANELGITPVIPGYFGTVTQDFADRNPGANVVPQGKWGGYERPGWLDPTTEMFAQVAADYYEISERLIGASGAYKMDPLHEGGRAGNVNVPAAAAGIEKALHTAHPKALWSLLGWQSNPTMTLLDGVVDKSRLLIVDGLSDTVTTLDRESRWPGIPYAFGSIYNFGGNTSMGAISKVWLERYFTARDKQNSSMNGVAILPEGFYNNPAAFELMAELPWMDSAPDHGQWFRDYAKGRYGTDAAATAWDTIASTAYSMDPIGVHSESHDGLFSAQPSLTTTKGRACCARGIVRYDMAAFAAALPQLIAANDSVVQRDAYEYDVTDVARQVIVNVSRDLLPQIKAAYDARDLAKFDELTGTWLDLIAQLDKILGTEADFMLGGYVARAEAQNPGIGAYDLQNLLTTWGTKKSFSLHDYANREWQGLMGDFYASRWQQYFAGLRTSIQTGEAAPSIDWFTVDDDWAKVNHNYPSVPSGDVIVEARKAMDLLGTGETRITFDSPAIRPGTPATITVKVQNISPLGTIDSADLTLNAPAGITVSAPDVRLENIGAGETQTATWEINVDGHEYPQAVAEFSVDTDLTIEGETTTTTTTGTVLVGAESASPWKKHSTQTDAEYAFAEDQIALRTTGNDFSKTSRFFSSAYHEKVLADGDVLTVHVDRQQSEGSRPWARSGLAVGTNITGTNTPLVVLALTPGNGCALTWNSGTNGSLDTHRNVTGFSGSAWLRLLRNGKTFVGSCSTDGVNWTTIGTATPAGFSADTVDAGLFSSAVNSGASDRILAVFSDWSIYRASGPQAWASVDGRKVALSADVALAGVEYAVDGGAWKSYSAPFTIEGTDSAVVAYRAADDRGVTGPSKSVSVAASDPGAAADIAPLGVAKTVLVGETATGFGALVTNAAGSPVLGATVEFSVTGGVFPNDATTATVTTNAAGIAVAPAVSSETAGQVMVSAAFAGRTVALPVVTVVEPAVAVDAELSATAASVSGKVVLTVTAKNTGTEAATIKVSTRYGTKSFAAVAPGASVSADIKTYLSAIPAGTVSAAVTGASGLRTVTTSYAAK